MDEGEEFLQLLERRTQTHGHFGHRDHLELSWTMLRRHGYDRGRAEIAAGLRRAAIAHGLPNRYHETITTFWTRILHHVMRRSPDSESFDQLTARFPLLLDKNLIERHWSRALLFDDPRSRTSWVAPDLRPLPSD